MGESTREVGLWQGLSVPVNIQTILPQLKEQVLLIINSIDTTDSLLQAHVSSINGDPSGRGSNFEDTATHLMLTDPVERNQSKQSNRKITVSSSLEGRGTGTGVDLR